MPEPVGFRLLENPREVKEIASGTQVRIRRLLNQRYGARRWRKMKGIARIEDDHGWIGDAEIHWFEAHGVGRVEWKIKKRL